MTYSTQYFFDRKNPFQYESTYPYRAPLFLPLNASNKVNESAPIRVSQASNHILIDGAGLIATKGEIKALGNDLYYIDYDSETPSEKRFSLFKSMVDKADCKDEKALKAFKVVRKSFKKDYYSGVEGVIARLFYLLFGCFDFKKTAIAADLNNLLEKIKALPSPPSIERDLPDLSEAQIFTDKLEGIGALGSYSTREYRVVWMSPDAFLGVDPYFKRYLDEESMPWLLDKMIEIGEGKSQERMAPLMKNPAITIDVKPGYQIIEHEGRHRALAAKLLKITKIPVAIPITKK